MLSIKLICILSIITLAIAAPFKNTGEAIVEETRKLVGLPYGYMSGSFTGPDGGIVMPSAPFCDDRGVIGVDDPALVMIPVYRATGLILGHWTGGNGQYSYAVTHGFQLVPIAEVLPGDVFYYGLDGVPAKINHTAVYMGRDPITNEPMMAESRPHWMTGNDCTTYPSWITPVRMTDLVPFAVRWWGYHNRGEIPNNGKAMRDAAMSRVGLDTYVWGGGNKDGPSTGILYNYPPLVCDDTKVVGFDCSGLTLFSTFQATGLIHDHWAQGQYNSANSKKWLKPLAERAPGDLMFYSNTGSASAITHVTVYYGVVDGVEMLVESTGHNDNDTCETISPPRFVPVRFNEKLIQKVARFYQTCSAELYEGCSACSDETMKCTACKSGYLFKDGVCLPNPCSFKFADPEVPSFVLPEAGASQMIINTGNPLELSDGNRNYICNGVAQAEYMRDDGTWSSTWVDANGATRSDISIFQAHFSDLRVKTILPDDAPLVSALENRYVKMNLHCNRGVRACAIFKVVDDM